MPGKWAILSYSQYIVRKQRREEEMLGAAIYIMLMLAVAAVSIIIGHFQLVEIGLISYGFYCLIHPAWTGVDISVHILCACLFAAFLLFLYYCTKIISAILQILLSLFSSDIIVVVFLGISREENPQRFWVAFLSLFVVLLIYHTVKKNDFATETGIESISDAWDDLSM